VCGPRDSASRSARSSSATIAQEFWRGTRVRQGATGTDFLTAAIGLVARNKRRYGATSSHVAVVIIFMGFRGQRLLEVGGSHAQAGQQVTVGAFTVRLNAVKVTDDGQKQMITADTTVFRDGKQLAQMYPARWFYRKHEEEPTTEVAIRRGFAEDLYLVMPAFSVEEQSASMGIHVNPLVTGYGPASACSRSAPASRCCLIRSSRSRREPAFRRGDRDDAAACAGASGRQRCWRSRPCR